jgi:hypothetical protein
MKAVKKVIESNIKPIVAKSIRNIIDVNKIINDLENYIKSITNS